MKKFKNLIFILVFVVLIVQLYVLYSDNDKATITKEPMVGISSFALYDIVKHIAKDSIKIINVLPLGVDPHSFEPTPKLMANIEKSDLLFFSGAGLEPWTQGFSFKSRAIEVSKYVDLRELGEGEHQHEHHDDDEEQCKHTGVDPHYWLDFSNMKKMTLLVRDELTKLQPEHKELYEKSADTYIQMLEKLGDAYEKELASCKLNLVIVNHNAIGYLAHNYGFEVESLSGITTEAQPSPRDLTRIFEEIQKDGVSTIFFENFVNNKAIRTVANDAKVELEVFHSLGNITADEAKQNLTYEQIMYTNLTKLSKALVCK